MKNFTFFNSIKTISFCISLVFISSTIDAQVVQVIEPNGGFSIDGNLQSNNPANSGDWVPGPAGSGGFVLNNDGTPVNPSTTGLVRDSYNTNTDNVFTGGSKANDNPLDWTWSNSPATGKGDIHNAMYHISTDASNDEWVFVASDRRTTNGTSYIDFEFYQNSLTANNNFGFNSAGPHGGRTINDILLTVEYGNGGSVATVFFYLWKDVGGGII